MYPIITPSEVEEKLDVSKEDLAYWHSIGLEPVWSTIKFDMIRYVDSTVHPWIILRV